MKKLFFILFIGVILVGCHPASIKEKIADKIESKCRGIDSCTTTINIQEVTDFKWDRLYLFTIGASLEDVNKALGFDYPYFEDIASRVVFTLGNKIVYHEDEFPNPKTKPTAGVIFRYIDNDIMHSYNFGNAVFNVTKTVVNGYKYYELTPKSSGR